MAAANCVRRRISLSPSPILRGFGRYQMPGGKYPIDLGAGVGQFCRIVGLNTRPPQQARPTAPRKAPDTGALGAPSAPSMLAYVRPIMAKYLGYSSTAATVSTQGAPGPEADRPLTGPQAAHGRRMPDRAFDWCRISGGLRGEARVGPESRRRP